MSTRGSSAQKDTWRYYCRIDTDGEKIRETENMAFGIILKETWK